MACTTQDLKSLLDDAWEAQNALTLREQLRSNEKDARAQLAGGSKSSISKIGHSHTDAPSGQGTITIAEIARAWRDLIDLFDASKSALAANSLTSDDEATYAEMKARLGCDNYSTRPDLCALRAVYA